MSKRQMATITAGLVLLAVATTVAFVYLTGDEIDRTFRIKLNTQHHEEERSGFQNGVELTKMLWRFVSHRKLSGKVAEARRQAGMHIVQGAYAIVWKNSTIQKFKIEYQLGFVDSKGLELAWVEPREVILLPSSEKESDGIFTIEVDDISVANMAAKMIVSASFENMNSLQGR